MWLTALEHIRAVRAGARPTTHCPNAMRLLVASAT